MGRNEKFRIEFINKQPDEVELKQLYRDLIRMDDDFPKDGLNGVIHTWRKPIPSRWDLLDMFFERGYLTRISMLNTEQYEWRDGFGEDGTIDARTLTESPSFILWNVAPTGYTKSRLFYPHQGATTVQDIEALTGFSFVKNQVNYLDYYLWLAKVNHSLLLLTPPVQSLPSVSELMMAIPDEFLDPTPDFNFEPERRMVL